MTTLNSGTELSFDLLAGALTGRDTARATGTLHVMGNPGGRIHLRDGGIVAVESAGSPGPDALLSRSGRISEGRIGSTALQVIAMMAAHDAAFTLVAGDIERCVLTADALDVAIPMNVPVEPVRLLQETSRRLSALSALPHPLSPHRERVAPTRALHQLDQELSPARREILVHASGRRCARDIAFVCGRSVYAVTIEVCRMVGDGLLTVVSGTSISGDDVPLPRSLRRQLLPRLFKQGERKRP
ncbi:MarR family transcriptional regulator [Lentzea sp. NEAU-D13]|uniref:MarR family transcriptional regulator n=1 Tax=Lentzea alba TaxID=2714351 RepID=A0A7C9VY83_9PSEU|nr:MarR family transcriptional regulator [Lentzea alba]NGY60797.1 MarR family transcriptional regulator [Lentzea alba]